MWWWTNPTRPRTRSRVWEETNHKLALIRLHGRNPETWNSQEATVSSSRFNHDYNDEELGGLASQTLEIAKTVERTQVVFNNNWEDQGQRNARTLIPILGTNVLQP
jgi:uncharacterized protein YecE (DUF72 family)